MNPKLKIMISMFFFGTVGLFIKYIPLSSAEIALYRAVIASVVIGLYLFFKPGKRHFSGMKNHGVKLFLSGAAMGLNWITLFEAYNYTSIALSTLCYYFAPVIVVVLSRIIYKERLSAKQVLCFIGSTVGLVFIIGGAPVGSGDLKGILLGLAAAFLYATVILINKSVKDIGGPEQTLLQFLSAAFVLLPYVAFQTGLHLPELSGGGLVNLLILGVVHTGIMYVLYFSAMGHLSGQNLSMLSYIDPLTAVLISVLVLREAVSAGQLLGGGAILVFTLINEVDFRKKLVKE